MFDASKTNYDFIVLSPKIQNGENVFVDKYYLKYNVNKNAISSFV